MWRYVAEYHKVVGGQPPHRPGACGWLEKRQMELAVEGQELAPEEQRDDGALEPGGLAEAIEGRRGEFVLPQPADAPSDGDGVNGEAEETLESDVVRQPWNQLSLHGRRRSIFLRQDSATPEQ